MKTLSNELFDKGFSGTEPTEPPVKRAKERLSDRDLRELMGTNRDTYKRGKGGAIRKK
ncbi:hypothetical protein [Sporosarcina sp. FSL K6-5500]|uniref:hypothetical protein n=1 Tax=Sporosarcina sp. FSL K6-5500 TaxID=2921558 RepID=UPI0030F68759